MSGANIVSMNNVSAIREKLRMQQAELAYAVGVTQSSISHYETGKADPSVDVGIRIAAVAKERGLVVSLDDIYAQDAS